MIQTKIETMLAERMGWSADIIGSPEIARAVERRRKACNLPDLQAYLQELQASTQEIEELIELLIVPETWFFRDGEPFNCLERYVTSEWFFAPNNRILRLLSVPCSSGEEPYSIAMTLLNAGLAPDRFQIDAVDFSKNSLQKAKEGLYSLNSFRGNNLDFKNRYFTKIGDQYQLSERVKNTVNFLQGNLVDQNFMINESPYNVIFCRNVLIYFNDLARKQTIKNLNRLLKNEGLLFLGPSEKAQIVESNFVSVQHPFAFAYQKKERPEANVKNHKEKPQPKNSEGKSTWQFLEKSQPINRQIELIAKQEFIKLRSEPVNVPAATSTAEIAKSQKPIDQPTAANLETARLLADRGQLSEAARLCETYLKQNSTSVEAYVLLGQIHQANGLETQAEQCFQKALYLEPNHYEALLHLALLKEHRGDIAGATILRQRIQRLQKK